MGKLFLIVYRSLPRWARIAVALFVFLSALPAVMYSWVVLGSMIMNKYELVDLTHRNCISKEDFLKYHEASKKYYEALALYSGTLLRDKMSHAELQLDLIVKDISNATSEYTNMKYSSAIARESNTDMSNALYIFKSEMKTIARNDFRNIDFDIYNTELAEKYCREKSEAGYDLGKKSLFDHYANSDVLFHELAPYIKPHCNMMKERIYNCYKYSIMIQRDRLENLELLRLEYEKSIPFKR